MKCQPKNSPSVKLRRYQAKGVEHLLRQPLGGLFMDPGTGKTLTVLSAFHVLRQKRLITKMFVLAPLRVATRTWTEEVAKWGFPYQVVVLHGPKKDERLAALDGDIFVLNYEGLPWFAEAIKPHLRAWPATRSWLIFDESTKVKHTGTQRFKTLRALLPLFGRRTVLTGTPAPNGLLDLFGQVYAADLGARLGRFITQYRRNYFYPTGYGGYTWVPQPDAEARIFKALAGFAYRVSDDVLDLPQRHDVRLEIELPLKARRLYEELEREYLIELEGKKVTTVNAGVLGSKLRQIANGALYDNDRVWHEVHDAKLEALQDLVEQLQGNPLLVGYEFDHDQQRIAKALNLGKAKNDATYPLVKGGTTAKRANELFDQFNRGNIPVLLTQFETAKYGLNLQDRCHHVALFGMPWDLETYIQFVKRVHRSGQKHRVTLHHFIAIGTRDERVFNVVTNTKAPSQARLLQALTE